MAFVRRRESDPSYEFTTGWLVLVLRRRYLDHLRSSRREDLRLKSAHERDEHEHEHESADWGAVSGTAALAMLADLPADQRVALVMR